MKEADRIYSIKQNGGRHLKHFKKENITYNMCMAAVESDGTALWLVPDEFRTEEIIRTALRTSGEILCDFPPELRTKEMCEIAVSSNGKAIDYVPDSLKTRNMYLLAAARTPSVLRQIPEEMLTLDFCAEVIKRHGCSAVNALPKKYRSGKFYLPLVEIIPELIWYLPQQAHTVGICKAAIKGLGFSSAADAIRDNPAFLSQLHTSLYDHDSCVSFVESELFTRAFEDKKHSSWNSFDHAKGLMYIAGDRDKPYSLKHILQWLDVCEKVVGTYPPLIKFVAPELLTEGLCLIAASKDGKTISCFPNSLRTKAVCTAAFENDSSSIEEIPRQHITYEMAEAAVRESGYFLEYIPMNLRTRDICLLAVRDKGGCLKDVPSKIRDREICLTAIEHSYGFHIFSCIPKRLIDQELCLAAIEHGCLWVSEIPEEFLSYDLYLSAVKHGIISWREAGRIPKEYFTEELCLALVENSANAIKVIPKDKLTEKVCLEAVKRDSRLTITQATMDKLIVQLIPPEMVTQEMADYVVECSAWAISYIPEAFVTEELLISVAEKLPYRLPDNFPIRLRTTAFFQRLSEANPDVIRILARYNIVPLD